MSSYALSAGTVDQTQAFPHLTPSQIDRIRHVGRVRQMQAGEILFEPGDTHVPFFVLLSGGMEIVREDVNGERPVTTHSAGSFTGVWRLSISTNALSTLML